MGRFPLTLLGSAASNRTTSCDMGWGPGGLVAWKEMLREFWEPFKGKVGEISTVGVRDVIDCLDALVVEPLVQVLAPRVFVQDWIVPECLIPPALVYHRRQ
jgi:hypothetical protein